MKNTKIFSEVSKICSYADEKLIEDVYFAFIRVITRQLREEKSIVLPKFGEFYLFFSKARKSFDVNNKTFRNVEPKTMIKFRANRDLKKYFYQIGEKIREIL